MSNKHPAKWTREDSYEAAFWCRVQREVFKMSVSTSDCRQCMPSVFVKDESLVDLRRSWISGWKDAS